MDIILDSNIFRGDITLRSKEIDVLLDYLNKTGSSFIMPQVILDEIKGLYKKLLIERHLDLSKATNNINLIELDKTKHLEIPIYNIDAEVSKYEQFILKKLRIKKQHIIPYNNDFLPVISQRAIDRIKPSGEKGQGFRDTLIWLTIKEYCKECPEKELTFISNNTDDFANHHKNNLHETLDSECKAVGIKVNFFKGLKEFIENHSTQIDFINSDWITANLDYNTISRLIRDDLNGSERRSIISAIQNETGSECLSYRVVYVDLHDDDEVSAYAMADNRLIANVAVKASIGVDYEIVFNWKGDSVYSSGSTIIKADILVTLTVIDKEITDMDITEIEI